MILQLKGSSSNPGYDDSNKVKLNVKAPPQLNVDLYGPAALTDAVYSLSSFIKR